MHYKAILFDLDGTLLDTLDDLADATNAVLRHYGYPEHARDAYRYFVGSGAESLIKSALPPIEAARQNIRQLVQQFNKEYEQRWHAKTRPYPGITGLLDWLQERKIPVNILSNKPHHFTVQCVATLLPHWEFAVVLGARDGVPKKPHPGSCLEIAAQNRLEPADFLYAGDSGIDMQTARAAGMTAVGVLWGFRSATELQENGAQFLAETPTRIRELIL